MNSIPLKISLGNSLKQGTSCNWLLKQ